MSDPDTKTDLAVSSDVASLRQKVDNWAAQDPDLAKQGPDASESAPEVKPTEMIVVSKVEQVPDDKSTLRVSMVTESSENNGEGSFLTLNAKVHQFENASDERVAEVRNQMQQAMEDLLATGHLEHSVTQPAIPTGEEKDYEKMFNQDPKKAATLLVLEQLIDAAPVADEYSNDFWITERRAVRDAAVEIRKAVDPEVNLLAGRIIDTRHPEAAKRLRNTNTPVTAEDNQLMTDTRYEATARLISPAVAAFLKSYDQSTASTSGEVKEATAKALKIEKPETKKRELQRAIDIPLTRMDDVFPSKEFISSSYSVLEGVRDSKGKALMLNRRLESTPDSSGLQEVHEAVGLSIEKTKVNLPGEGEVDLSEMDSVKNRLRATREFNDDLKILAEIGKSKATTEQYIFNIKSSLNSRRQGQPAKA